MATTLSEFFHRMLLLVLTLHFKSRHRPVISFSRKLPATSASGRRVHHRHFRLRARCIPPAASSLPMGVSRPQPQQQPMWAPQDRLASMPWAAQPSVVPPHSSLHRIRTSASAPPRHIQNSPSTATHLLKEQTVISTSAQPRAPTVTASATTTELWNSKTTAGAALGKA